MPNLLSLIVTLVHSDPQLVTVESKNFGNEFPRPWDCVGFEIIAETKVAHHFKEHKMSLGTPNVIKVIVLATSTCALLHADSALVWRCFVTNKIRLERHHARNGEKYGRIVRDQARRLHRRVALRLKEAREGLTKLIGRCD